MNSILKQPTSRDRKGAISRITVLLLLTPALVLAQGKTVPTSELLKPLKNEWLTYNGDYTGKRFSALTQVNQVTVKNLTLAWMSRITPGPAAPSGTNEASSPHESTGCDDGRSNQLISSRIRVASSRRRRKRPIL